MVSCARATRGRGLPSLDARSEETIYPALKGEYRRTGLSDAAGGEAGRCPPCSQKAPGSSVWLAGLSGLSGSPE